MLNTTTQVCNENSTLQLTNVRLSSSFARLVRNFNYSDILTTADNVTTFRIAIKPIAAQYGLYATFMPKPVEANIYKLTDRERKKLKIESLPGSFEEALGYMEKSLIAKTALGSHIVDEFVTAKQIEWDSFRTYVSQWEIDKYLARY